MLALILVLCAAGAWALFGGRKSREIKVLATATVERGAVRKVLEATGIVKAQVGAQVKIGARATGVLTRVAVKVGDRVKAGDLVAEIDDRELRSKIAEARARWELAQAKAVRAAKELGRKKTLVSKGLDSQSNLDQAIEDARVTTADAAASQAALEVLEVQLSYYKIYAPMDGVVSQVAAQEGETVVSGLQVSNLITVLDPGRLEMWVYVDESDVGQCTVGLPVEFWVDAYPDTTFRGQVDAIYPEPEVRDNIVYYKALVRVGRDEAERLRPEMTTQCRIVVKQLEDVLSVPNTALKWVNDKQVIYVLGPDGRPRQVDPDLGLQGLDRSQVLSGIEAGQKVATQLVIPDAPAGKGKGK
ncbi:MAG: efflux RND transporter periplasmic adaptor subunit [Desulfovibrionaceae bacterium]